LASRCPDAEVTVLESSAVVGGKLKLAQVAGVQFDVGAEELVGRRPEGIDLIADAGLAEEMISPLTSRSYLFTAGALHPMPRTMMGIPADADAVREAGILSEDALARIANEPSLPPLPPLTEDVSVGALTRARLGEEVTDRVVEPILGGIHSGLIDAMSFQASVPPAAAALRAGGSLVAALRPRAPRPTPPPQTDAKPRPVFASLTGGLGRLPGELASAGSFTVRTSVTASAITRTATGFAIDTTGGERLVADAVIVSTPAAPSAKLLGELAPAAAAELARFETSSSAMVTLALRGVALPPGSGMLIGIKEGFTVKGITFFSQKWPGTPDGLQLVRASVGRAGDTQTLQRDDDELVAIVRRELPALIGADAEPIDTLVTRWMDGQPQYNVGHLDRVARIKAAVAAVPGLEVCGASYDGVGIPAVIASGRTAAAAVLSAVAPEPTG